MNTRNGSSLRAIAAVLLLLGTASACSVSVGANRPPATTTSTTTADSTDIFGCRENPQSRLTVAQAKFNELSSAANKRLDAVKETFNNSTSKGAAEAGAVLATWGKIYGDEANQLAGFMCWPSGLKAPLDSFVGALKKVAADCSLASIAGSGSSSAIQQFKAQTTNDFVDLTTTESLFRDALFKKSN